MSVGTSRCADCGVDIEGPWTRCPLCGEPVHAPPTTSRPTGTAESHGAAETPGAAESPEASESPETPEASGGREASVDQERIASPFPDVPLRFSRRRLLRALVLTSVGLVLASFAVQLLFSPGVSGLGVLRSVWLAVAALWLVTLMAVRKRRNIAKSTVYLVVLAGLVCVYWDYLQGWRGWSLTYVVPILCASSLLALMIVVRAMHVEVGEHIVYSGLIVILGLTPLVFLALGWVSTPLPSALCGALCAAALGMLQLSSGSDARHELAKRLHL